MSSRADQVRIYYSYILTTNIISYCRRFASPRRPVKYSNRKKCNRMDETVY